MKQCSFLITGGTGFIGQQLCRQLLDAGHELILLVRNPQKTASMFEDRVRSILSFDELPVSIKIDYIINLAGEPILGWPWTAKRKQKLLNSRILTTEKLVDWVAKATNKPKLLINASAIGYYGIQSLSDTSTFTEDSPASQNDFASQLCFAWEHAAQKITKSGTGLTILRFGVVLGNTGGALPRLLLPIQLFMGGRIGSGLQIFSWVHIEDLLRIMNWVIVNNKIGVYNAVAPNPLPQAELVSIATNVLHRPNWLPMPAWIMKLLLGEQSTLLVDGQRVMSTKLQADGFKFYYPNMQMALENLLG